MWAGVAELTWLGSCWGAIGELGRAALLWDMSQAGCCHQHSTACQTLERPGPTRPGLTTSPRPPARLPACLPAYPPARPPACLPLL